VLDPACFFDSVDNDVSKFWRAHFQFEEECGDAFVRVLQSSLVGKDGQRIRLSPQLEEGDSTFPGILQAVCFSIRSSPKSIHTGIGMHPFAGAVLPNSETFLDSNSFSLKGGLDMDLIKEVVPAFQTGAVKRGTMMQFYQGYSHRHSAPGLKMAPEMTIVPFTRVCTALFLFLLRMVCV